MADHGLRGIARASIKFGEPTKLLVACLCGDVSGSADGSTWTVTDNGDGTASVSPSINWPDHFHETFSRAPLIDDPFRDMVQVQG